MTPRRPLRIALLAPFVWTPLVAGCVSGVPGAPEPSAASGIPVAVAEPAAPSLPVLPEAAAVAPAPVGPSPAEPGPASPTPLAVGGPTPGATAVAREPSRRPAATHGTAPSRRPGTGAAASAPTGGARETAVVLPTDVCQGLAEYGVFALDGDTHRWCLAQQQAR